MFQKVERWHRRVISREVRWCRMHRAVQIDMGLQASRFWQRSRNTSACDQSARSNPLDFFDLFACAQVQAIVAEANSLFRATRQPRRLLPSGCLSLGRKKKGKRDPEVHVQASRAIEDGRSTGTGGRSLVIRSSSPQFVPGH